jgi:C-terminal processing protease CtpA/Prc
MALPAKRFNDDTRDALLTYIQNGGDSSGIVLSEKHAKQLDRIRFADEKIRERRYTKDQIAQFIIGKFGVCRDTAYKAIVYAEYIYSSSYPLNKKYEIQIRIEFLKKKINDAYTDKDALTASQLEKQLREYIKMYPDYQPPRSPKNITFVINGDLHQTNNVLNLDQAISESDELIKQLEEREDY